MSLISKSARVLANHTLVFSVAVRENGAPVLSNFGSEPG
jgi:hypothetical protein